MFTLIIIILCPDTYAASYISSAASYISSVAREARAAAEQAEIRKKEKYSHLEPFNSFTPIAVETSGVLGAQSKYFLKELGYRLRQITAEERSYSFLIQRFLLLCKEETLLL